MAEKTEDMVALAGIEHDAAEVDLSATTRPDTEDLIIIENADLGTYEAVLGSETVAGVVYSKAGDRVTLLATSVFPAFREGDRCQAPQRRS